MPGSRTKVCAPPPTPRPEVSHDGQLYDREATPRLPLRVVGLGLCLKGRGGDRGSSRAVAERLTAVVGGAVTGGWKCGWGWCCGWKSLWGRVRAGVLGGEGGTPLPLQVIPCAGGGGGHLKKVCLQLPCLPLTSAGTLTTSSSITVSGDSSSNFNSSGTVTIGSGSTLTLNILVNNSGTITASDSAIAVCCRAPARLNFNTAPELQPLPQPLPQPSPPPWPWPAPAPTLARASPPLF